MNRKTTNFPQKNCENTKEKLYLRKADGLACATSGTRTRRRNRKPAVTVAKHWFFIITQEKKYKNHLNETLSLFFVQLQIPHPEH